jgi:NTP pyrophosphatase (non-canonical NTP hydrolase)
MQIQDKQLANLMTLQDMVIEENDRQLKKWGVQWRTPFEWITYLTEEVGELAQAVSENEYRNGKSDDVVKEAIQVATLALKIAEMYL